MITRIQPVPMVDRRGAEIPDRYAHMLCELAKVRINQVRGEWQRPRMPTPEHDAAIPLGYNIDRAPAPVVVVVPPQLRRANSQNVHEHTIIAAAKKNMQDLLKSDGGCIDRGCITRAKDELTNAIAKGIEGYIARNAMSVLNRLGNEKHSAFGCSEQEVFCRVWRAIEKINDEAVKANVKETLVKRLADCIEDDTHVCSTGRMTRIVSALEGVEDFSGIEKSRPMWVVTEEIGTLAAKVRERCLDAASTERRAAYNRSEDDTLSEEMKTQFETEAYKTYAETLGMSMGILTPLVQIYSNSF